MENMTNRQNVQYADCSCCLNYPRVDIPCLVVEIDPYPEQRPCVGSERQSVLLVLDLLQCLFRRTVQFELHNIDVAVGLQHQVDASARSMVFCFYIEPNQFEDDEQDVLVVYFQIANQFVGSVGKETLQADEESLRITRFNLLYEMDDLER